MDFITNKKGNRFLAHNGFVYKLNKTAQYTYWKCIRNDREKCMGRLIVEGNKVTEKNVHNHVQETAPPIIDPSTVRKMLLFSFNRNGQVFQHYTLKRQFSVYHDT